MKLPRRMLEAGKKALAADRDWLKERRAKLAKAQTALDAAFEALKGAGK